MNDSPPICATVVETTTEAAAQRMAAVAPHAGWIELRVDAAPVGALDVEALVEGCPRPLVVTCRAQREGGRWEGTEAARLHVLREAARCGATYVDVEWDAVDALGDLPPSCRRVVSRHDFPGTVPPTSLLEAVRHPAASVQKVARAVDGAEAALALGRLAAAEAKPTVAIAMGFPGVVSRIAAGRWGAPWTYAAADPERPAAPGQLPAETLAGLLRGRRVSPATSLYGVLGAPVGHSRSPELHNAAFAHLGADAVYAWLESQDPTGFLEEAWRDPGLDGLSVTIPHKVAVARARGVDLSPEAAATGAVNTLARTARGWTGSNTDASAALQLLPEVLPEGVGGARVGVLGSGGAARAVCWAVRELNGALRVFARSGARGRALAAEFGGAYAGGLEHVATTPLEAIVNATPVGMAPHPSLSPVPASVWERVGAGYDLVYTPRETRFLSDARAAGARVVDGVDHFARQARGQLSAWLGAEALSPLPLSWLLARLD
jgi:3-dehydroquinate dehydratase/shikimate dehydrogenase